MLSPPLLPLSLPISRPPFSCREPLNNSPSPPVRRSVSTVCSPELVNFRAWGDGERWDSEGGRRSHPGVERGTDRFALFSK